METKAKEHNGMRAIKCDLLASRINRIMKKFVGISVFVLIAGGLLAVSGNVWAKKPNHSDNSPITSGPDPITVEDCGNTTNSPTGFGQSNVLYILDPSKTFTTSSGDCIDLGGSQDGLFLNGATITGTGSSTTSGIGVKVGGSQDIVEGGNSTIMGYATGILNEGSENVGDNFNVFGDGVGLWLRGSQNDYVGIAACGNSLTGIFLDHGANNYLSNILAGDETVGCTGNGGDGVLIQGVTTGGVNLFGASNNGLSGIHLGGPGGGENNNNVKVCDGFTATAVEDNMKDGIFLDTSESSARDQVTTVDATHNMDFDLHDASSNCAGNFWYGNLFSTSEAGVVSMPACIQ